MDEATNSAPAAWHQYKEFIYKLSSEKGLTELADPSIYMCKSLEELHLPASLTYTEEEFTYKVDYFSAPNMTIYTPAGSAAEAFAKAQGVNVVNE